MTTHGVDADAIDADAIDVGVDVDAAGTAVPRSRRLRGTHGETIVAIVVLPTLLISLLLVVQFALALHARQVMAGAAQDGAAVGAAAASSPAAGQTVTDQLVTSTVGGLVDNYSSTVASNGNDITVSVRADARKVFPLFPTITLTASSSATIEQFRSQHP